MEGSKSVTSCWKVLLLTASWYSISTGSEVGRKKRAALGYERAKGTEEMQQAVILVPNVDLDLPRPFSAYISVCFARDLNKQQDSTVQLHFPHFFLCLYHHYCLISVF